MSNYEDEKSNISKCLNEELLKYAVITALEISRKIRRLEKITPTDQFQSWIHNNDSSKLGQYLLEKLGKPMQKVLVLGAWNGSHNGPEKDFLFPHDESHQWCSAGWEWMPHSTDVPIRVQILDVEEINKELVVDHLIRLAEYLNREWDSLMRSVARMD